MPFHFPPLSRRRFIHAAAGAAAGLACSSRLLAEDVEIDPHRWALLSDTHISQNAKLVTRDVNMTDHLAAVVREVTALKRMPANILINGDLAYLKGEPRDYESFVKLIAPLRGLKASLHLTLGNHDDRAPFLKGVDAAASTEPAALKPVESKYVALVETPRANVFLLDTLNEVNKTPGRVGKAQLKWLAARLDEHKDKPAVVIAHHPFEKPPVDEKTGKPKPAAFGIIDTAELLDALLPRKQVKLFIHGHSHDWRATKEGDLPILGLPAVAYTFKKEKPSGWVDMALGEKSAQVKLIALDKAHAEHEQVIDIPWRG